MTILSERPVGRRSFHPPHGDVFPDNSRRSGLDKDVEQFLLELNRQLQPRFQSAMDRIADIPSLKEGVVYQIDTGGKRLRAALCVTVCEIFCSSYRPALNFAAAIEHLQNFTLIHDDIADGDAERRGQASAWKRYGIAHGMNIGDIFVPLAALAILEADYPSSVKLELLQVISEFGLEVAEGQSLDINLRRNNNPTLEDYIACTQKKTGAFLAIAAVGGGIIGGANQRQIECLKQFALLAGVAFQIKDDVLDYIGGKGRMVGSDILEGKRTPMVIYAAMQASQEERTRMMEILNKPWTKTSESDVAWVHTLFQRTEASQKAEEMAEKLIDEALDYLQELPETPAKYRFLRLSKYLTRRIH